MIFIRSCSTFSGVVSFVSSSRRDSRSTCVSTTTPTAIPYHDPSTTFPSSAPPPAAAESPPSSAEPSPQTPRQHPRRTLDRLRLIPKESRRPNQLLKLRQGSRSHRLRRRKRLEQRRSHQIHPHIRTLRRQNRRHRQLPRTLDDSAHKPLPDKSSAAHPESPQPAPAPAASSCVLDATRLLLSRNRLRRRNRPSLLRHLC
jgi:hypothetical protein